jgi:hypothetical protein
MITDLEAGLNTYHPSFAGGNGLHFEELVGQKANIFKSEFTNRRIQKTVGHHPIRQCLARRVHNRKKNGDLTGELAESPHQGITCTTSPISWRSRKTWMIAGLEDQLRHSQKMEAGRAAGGGIATTSTIFSQPLSAMRSIMQLKLQRQPFKDTAKQILSAAERGSS